MKDSNSSGTKDSNSSGTTAILVALIACVGTIIVAYINKTNLPSPPPDAIMRLYVRDIKKYI